MQSISRFTLAFLLAIATSLGAFALVGCTDDSQQSQSSATQSESTAADDSSSAADDEEQDNCYGNDLPAKKQ